MSEETNFSKVRIEMLCDGIFAIAMTLLVLDLKVPELAKEVSPAELLHALAEHKLSYFAFFLTFMLAGAFWIQHHVLFHYIARATKQLALLNLVFLMFVSLLPFTTSLYATFGPRQVGVCFYFGNQFILGLLMAAQWLLAKKQGLLTGSTADPKRRQFAAMISAFPVMFGALFLVSLVSPEFAGFGAFPALIAIIAIRKRASKRAHFEATALKAMSASALNAQTDESLIGH